ncbi:hypothetical protein [Nitrobacter winogradskyi]|uniref:hypothetical protein n=1 Tax=Nitrobacter winogradskyi TaxID=913 RepID=UPI0015E834FE|nr:hypothetical protein [Nitrobacter winogradskyi]
MSNASNDSAGRAGGSTHLADEAERNMASHGSTPLDRRIVRCRHRLGRFADSAMVRADPGRTTF